MGTEDSLYSAILRKPTKFVSSFSQIIHQVTVIMITPMELRSRRLKQETQQLIGMIILYFTHSLTICKVFMRSLDFFADHAIQVNEEANILGQRFR